MKQQVWMIIEMKFEAIKAWHLIISFKGSSNFVFSFFLFEQRKRFPQSWLFSTAFKNQKKWTAEFDVLLSHSFRVQFGT
jgi:hypothetical protein